MYLECSRNQQSVYKDSLPSCLDRSSSNSFCSTIAFPLSLAWLLTLTDKARLSYRILIVDGHGSHLTEDFIDYCNTNKIHLMVFPPHSTHSLQPFDVVMFSLLSKAYSAGLLRHLHRSQGLISVTKGNF
jgi:hypothetical protein